jgi:hypothetical protein
MNKDNQSAIFILCNTLSEFAKILAHLLHEMVNKIFWQNHCQSDGQCTLFANGLFCLILVIDQLEQIFTLPLATATRQEILHYRASCKTLWRKRKINELHAIEYL